MREGLAFIRGWQGALSVIVLFMIANLLLSPAFSLLPLLVIDHFQGGAGEYAAMEALAGIGMLAGGLFLGVWGGSRRKMSTMLASCLALSIGVTALGLVPMDLILAAYAIAAAIGITLALLNGSFMAMLQAKVPFDKQGRVFALISAGVTAMMPAGLLLAGPLADLLGVRAWYLIAGVPMALLTVVFMAMPSVTRIEERVVSERPIAAEE